jgi:hypothetical protein
VDSSELPSLFGCERQILSLTLRRHRLRLQARGPLGGRRPWDLAPLSAGFPDLRQPVLVLIPFEHQRWLITLWITTVGRHREREVVFHTRQEGGGQGASGYMTRLGGFAASLGNTTGDVLPVSNISVAECARFDEEAIFVV